MRLQISAHRAPLLHRVALAQKGIAQPVPVRIFRRHQLQHRLIFFDFALKRLRRIRVQIHMSVCMISYRFCARPQLQRLRGVRVPFQFLGIDEAVRRRHVPHLQYGQRIPDDFDPAQSSRKISIQGQIIKGDGNLLASTNRTKCEEK